MNVGLLLTLLSAAEPIRLAAPELQCAATDVRALRPGETGEPPATAAPAPQARIPRGWIAVGAGAAVMVAGGVLYALARVDESNLRIGAGRAKEASGIFLLGAGLGASTAALHWALGPGARQAVWGPLAAGAAMLAVGGALYLVAWRSAQNLRSGAADLLTPAELDAAIATARTEETLGFGFIGLGTGALVSSALLLAFGVEAPGSVSVSAGPRGAGLVFAMKL